MVEERRREGTAQPYFHTNCITSPFVFGNQVFRKTAVMKDRSSRDAGKYSS